MVNVKLLHDRVLLKGAKSGEQTSKSGIILNQSIQTVQEAIVVAHSSGFYSNGIFVQIGVENGDMVLINNGSGQKIKVDGEEYVLVSEHEILMVLNK